MIRTSLQGANPCRDKNTFVCRAKIKGDNTCPAEHEDCSLSNEVLDVTFNGDSMVIEEHSDTRIVLISQRGFGRHLTLDVSIGARSAPVPSSAALAYQPPTIRAFETLEAQNGGASHFTPGATIIILGITLVMAQRYIY